MSAEGISELIDARGALLAAAQAAGPDELGHIVAQAEAMYERAIRYGHHPFALDALEIACWIPDVSGESWASLSARYDRLRREIEARSLDVRLRLARADFHQGTEAAARGQPDAERLLSAVLPVLREFPGEAGKAAHCERSLRLIALRTAPRQAMAGTDQQQPQGSDQLLDGALALAAEGHTAQAMERLVAASQAAAAAGDTDQALVCAGYRASIALRVDPAGAQARLLAVRTADALDARLDAPPPAGPSLRDLAQYLRAEIARLDGDPGAPARLAELERAQLAAGFGELAAGTAVRLARVLLAAGRPADALDTVLPALLALDAVRFTLPDAARRGRSLLVEVADGYDTAFRAAAACGDHVIIAELIEVARGNPIPRPRSSAQRDDAISALAGLLGPPDAADEPRRTTLAPPPALRTPWGTRALGQYLSRAQRYATGLRDPAEVQWRIAP